MKVSRRNADEPRLSRENNSVLCARNEVGFAEESARCLTVLVT